MTTNESQTNSDTKLDTKPDTKKETKPETNPRETHARALARTKPKAKTRDALVFVLIALSIVSMFGGFALVSRGVPTGWIGIVAAAPMLVIVQRAMHAGASVAPPRVVRAPARASEDGPPET